MPLNQLNRKLIANLLHWKDKSTRKPLIIRGARQVGKTFLVREFAKHFDTYIELNLEKQKDRSLFDTDEINDIITKAQFLKGQTIVENEPVLLFIDEIQESPKALALLRYFFEERPDVHVIAAGSLLEFALTSVSSMPVGRIEIMYLHPINFHEFLEAKEAQKLCEAFETVPIPDIAHEYLLSAFHEYALVGGMPELLSEYLKTSDPANLGDRYRQLWQVYKDDIIKYARSVSEQKVIRHIVETAPAFLERIKFKGFGNSNYRSREVGEAFRTLDQAKLIRLNYPSSSVAPPVVLDHKKRPRLQFLDTGLLNQALNIQGDLVGVDSLNDAHNGHIIEHLIRQELISLGHEADGLPPFWVREQKGTNSEVDILFPFGSKVIPIEVKKGAQGRLRSLHEFVDRSSHPYAVRMYSGKLGVEQHTTRSGTPYLLLNLPYYASTRLPLHLKWFVENHALE